jgi:sugar-specific transcriptional regulator TrmB
MIERLLQLGFTAKEAALYLAALELGESSPVSTIAKRGNINRTSAYDLLEQLSHPQLG